MLVMLYSANLSATECFKELTKLEQYKCLAEEANADAKRANKEATDALGREQAALDREASAISQRDVAVEQRDQARTERDHNAGKLAAKEDEIRVLRLQHDANLVRQTTLELQLKRANTQRWIFGGVGLAVGLLMAGGTYVVLNELTPGS